MSYGYRTDEARAALRGRAVAAWEARQASIAACVRAIDAAGGFDRPACATCGRLGTVIRGECGACLLGGAR